MSAPKKLTKSKPRAAPVTPSTGSRFRTWAAVFALTTALVAYGYLQATRLTVEAVFKLSEEHLAIEAQLLERDASIFEVKDLPGRGKGVIAARDIEQGELIIKELPLFVVPNKISVSPSELLMSLLRQIPTHKRRAFWGLSAVHLNPDVDPNPSHEHPELALAIFQTNAVAASLVSKDGERQPGVGIFPRMARLNHACSSAFNVVYSWRDQEGALTVHALNNIRKGEELLTTYGDTKKPRNERQSHLLEQYDFTCTCAVCSLPKDLSVDSDKRLQEISSLYAELSTWQHAKISGREAIEIVNKIWAVEEEEGYWSERGRLAADAAWVSAAHHDEKATKQWAALATKWYGYEMGRDSMQVGEMSFVEEQPEKYPAWGLREPETVGGPRL